MKNASILGSNLKDFLSFYGLTILLILCMFFIKGSWDHAIMFLGVFLFIDVGHAYTTMFRTYLRKEEFQRSPLFYYLAPVVVFATMYSWSYFGWPLLWRFMFYMTFFHHLRQNYGLFMWYSKLEKFEARKYKIHIYLMALIPFTLFHFRELDYRPLYQSSEMNPGNPFPGFFYALLAYTLYYLGNLFWMFKKYVKKEVGLGLALSFMMPASFNYICMLVFKNTYQSLIPLLAFHGFSYLALMAHSMKKLHRKPLSGAMAWTWLSLSIVFCVGIEFWITEPYEIYGDPNFLVHNPVLSIIVAVSQLPNLLHYFYDAILWKRDNPDFQIIVKE